MDFLYGISIKSSASNDAPMVIAMSSARKLHDETGSCSVAPLIASAAPCIGTCSRYT